MGKQTTGGQVINFSGVQQVKSGGESTNITQTYDDKIDKIAKPVRGGDYLLMFYCEIKTSVADTSTANARVLLNGTEIAITNWNADRYHSFSGVGHFAFNDGDTPRVQIQFKRIGASATITIRRAYAALVPVMQVE